MRAALVPQYLMLVCRVGGCEEKKQRIPQPIACGWPVLLSSELCKVCKSIICDIRYMSKLYCLYMAYSASVLIFEVQYISSSSVISSLKSQAAGSELQSVHQCEPVYHCQWHITEQSVASPGTQISESEVVGKIYLVSCASAGCLACSSVTCATRGQLFYIQLFSAYR